MVVPRKSRVPSPPLNIHVRVRMMDRRSRKAVPPVVSPQNATRSRTPWSAEVLRAYAERPARGRWHVPIARIHHVPHIRRVPTRGQCIKRLRSAWRSGNTRSSSAALRAVLMGVPAIAKSQEMAAKWSRRESAMAGNAVVERRARRWSRSASSISKFVIGSTQ